MLRYLPLYLLLAAGLIPTSAFAKDESPEQDFVQGDYVMVGRTPKGGKAYVGRARISADGKELVLTRTIGKRKTIARGGLSTVAEAKVLRFLWTEGKVGMEMVCQFGGDFDNNARLTCLWGPPSYSHKQAGLEAMFAAVD